MMNRLAMALCLFWGLSTTVAAARADNVPRYRVDINQTADVRLDQGFQDVSALVALDQAEGLDAFALVSRTRGDLQRFGSVLRSQGYYRGRVFATIAGRDLDDPELYDALDRLLDTEVVTVVIQVDPGPQFRLRRIEFEGEFDRAMLDDIAPKPGDPARAQPVLAVRDALLLRLFRLGHASAVVESPRAILDEDAESLDVSYRVTPGPLTPLGDISVDGLEHVAPSFIENRLQVRRDDVFDPQAIDATRQDLASLGVFSVVTAATGELDDDHRVPLTFAVTERKRHSASLGAGFSTDLGGNLSSRWQNRNLLGGAERLELGGSITQFGGNSTTGIGYHVGAAFDKPDFVEREQNLQLSTKALQQSLIAYEQTMAMAEARISRRLAKTWRGDIGLAIEQSRIIQEGDSRDYTLVSLPAALKYDNTDDLLDPRRGARATLGVTPTQPLSGAAGAFVQIQWVGSTYWDASDDGRSILALRGSLMNTLGSDTLALPPDRRAYAGGGSTVRGYRFQSIGPRFDSGNPRGGNAMSAFTAEFRQRWFDDWGGVLFAEMGQVSEDGLPFSGRWRRGAGAGVRYFTGFGPVRLDVGLPLDKLPGNSAFEVYIGLGQAF